MKNEEIYVELKNFLKSIGFASAEIRVTDDFVEVKNCDEVYKCKKIEITCNSLLEEKQGGA